MNSIFKDIIEFDYWANNQILTILEHQKVIDKDILMFHHILEAQRVWIHRILNLPVDLSWFDDNLNIIEFRPIMEASVQKIRAYLETAPNLEQSVHFQNIKKENSSFKSCDILFHFLNHGTHHRAQILISLKNQGISIPDLDYLYWKNII